ncbi:MAG: pilus assembly protein PilP [Polyangiaceae bacterium]
MSLCSRLLLLGACLAASACEDNVIQSSALGTAQAPASSAPVDRKALIAGAESASPVGSGAPRIDFQEMEFGESDRSRDPFRSFADSFIAESRSTAKNQREVVLSDFGLDELKLVGIVTGVPDPRAMLVNPQGRGHVVRRGQFVGRAEVVHGDSKGAPAFEVNWRIDRIRDGDLVLVREDPKNPEVPSATRIIALRPDAEVKTEAVKAD